MKGSRRAAFTGLFIALAFVLTATPSTLAVVSYVVPTGTVGNQAFGGTLGMDFDVTSPITINSLGVFDSGSNGLSNTLNAYLFDRNNTAVPLATVQFTPGSPGTLVGGSRFKLLGAPLNLPAGFQGSIVADSYSGAEPNGNQGVSPLTLTTSGAGRINFVGGGRFGNAGQFPTGGDGGPPNRYAAGTFDFSFVQTPANNVTAYQIPSPVAGGQNFGGSLGMDFDVNSPIKIDQLGVFDSNGDGLQATITARVYDRNNTAVPLATIVFAPGEGTLVGGSRFKALPTSLTLPAGFAGTIVAEGYGPLELLGNSGGVGNFDGTILNTGNNAIAFVGLSRFGNAGQFPATVDGGPVARYGAGTFVFSTVQAVPEPATVALLLMGGLGIVGRRRRAA